MKNIGVFVDVSNLYYCITKKYKGRKLDYKVYYDSIKDLGTIKSAFAYGAQLGGEADNFIFFLRNVGFITKYKKPKVFATKRKADWDVGITIDMVDQYSNFDLIVLGTADGDLAPAVKWLQARDKKVVIFACGISKDLKQIAYRYIEIPESMLENEATKTEGSKLPDLRSGDGSR